MTWLNFEPDFLQIPLTELEQNLNLRFGSKVRGLNWTSGLNFSNPNRRRIRNGKEMKEEQKDTERMERKQSWTVNLCAWIVQISDVPAWL